jgi:exonuclease III
VSLEETSSRNTNYRKTGKDTHQYRIGTWNERTLNQGGELENLQEMEKNGVSVMGVSKVRWKGHGDIRSGDCTMYCSGGEKSERGVAIEVHKSIVGSVVQKIVRNDRLIAGKLNAKPVNVLIVQVYMPTSDYEEVEELYDRIEGILKEGEEGDTNTIIMGDWNIFVGDKSNGNICGPIWTGK